MLGRWGKDAGSLLGVEITPPFIRLVQLRRHRGGYCVQAWALEPLPAAATHNGWISDVQQVGACLLQAVQHRVGTARRAAIALPAGLIIEKQVAMPVGFDDHAIAENLSADVGPFIPFALEDAAIDFQIVGIAPDDPQCQHVLVAACHLALLDALQASLEVAGVHACAVESDAHALHRAVRPSVAGGELLLQLEADTLVFHEQGADPVPLRREVPIQRQGDAVAALVAAVDNYVLSSPGRALPKQLLLCGAGVPGVHVCDPLQRHLGIAVSAVDPFQGMTLAPGLEAQALMAQAPSLAIACGLALREGERCLV
ncbi:type IV pilus biogenesis protein PilM [Pseudomonas sp. NUPR-001]|uniref:type IV pilus biogenesis protein PilM n=1 Tax=Pseudomonas sp. NUPR-001 TaxID=3416058 RepID=UPI003F9D9715